MLDPNQVRAISELVFDDLSGPALESVSVGGVDAQMYSENAFFKDTRTGVAVIPVRGVLVNRLGYAASYATGYDYLSRAVREATSTDSVSGVIFDIDSPGGMAMGNFELVEEIKQLTATKPTVAIVNGMATSGAYSIASATSKIVATKSSAVGSIGVVSTHVSFEKNLEKSGIEVTLIYAGKHKVDGNPYQSLSEETRSAMQSSVERLYETFVSVVAAGRGMKASKVRATEAAVYDAEDAKDKGLIDEVAQPDVAVSAFINGLSRPSKRGTDMQTEHVTEGLEAPATAQENEQTQQPVQVVDQKARIKAILSSESAKGREQMAEYLAFETDMSEADAVKMLDVAPKAEVVKSANVFENMMDQTEQPGIGPDAGQETVSVADGIVRNFKLVTGRK